MKPGKKASGKELSLAKDLIEHLAGPFKPEELHDTYRENVERLIEQKRQSTRHQHVAGTDPRTDRDHA